MRFRKNNELDVPNGRFIFLYSQALGKDLCVGIRKSDTELYFWMMDLTPGNLTDALKVIDEDAPGCYMAVYEGDALKETAAYIKSYGSAMPFDKFMDDVERITSPLMVGDIIAEPGTADPVLACFPGLRWGMTKEEMVNTFDKDMFYEPETETVSLDATLKIFGKWTLVAFRFNDGRLKTIYVSLDDKEDCNKYLDALTQAYGTPHQTTYLDAVIGRNKDIEDDPTGDCYAWKTDKLLIILDSRVFTLWYKPLD